MSLTPEQVAHVFHDTYCALAPAYGIGINQTLRDWNNVTEKEKKLMIAVAEKVQEIITEDLEKDAETRERLDYPFEM